MPDLSKMSTEELLDLAEHAQEQYQRRNQTKTVESHRVRRPPRMHPGEPMLHTALYTRRPHWILLKAAAMDQNKGVNQLLREIIQKYLEDIGYL